MSESALLALLDWAAYERSGNTSSDQVLFSLLTLFFWPLGHCCLCLFISVNRTDDGSSDAEMVGEGHQSWFCDYINHFRACYG